MRTASRFIATAVVAAGISVSGASAALAQDDCAYVPTSCETPTEVVPTQQNRVESDVNARTNPDTLPFTGGEIALGVLAGAGAVGAGAALVVAARRRPSPTA
jgi:hypothetical protein